MTNLPIHLTPEQSRRNSTAVVRAQLALLAKGNVEKVQEWLDRAAMEDPAKALDLFLKLLEFSIPKLSRAEVAITDPTQDGVAHLTIEQLQELLRQARTIEGQFKTVAAS